MVMAMRWAALGASVRGASHEKNGTVNQDAVRLKNPTPADDVLLLAIADGHGSTRSFRSDRGSALAAECALSELARLTRRLGPHAALSIVRNHVRNRWPKDLIRAWKKAVRADIAAKPFTQLDFAAFPDAPPVLKPDQELPLTAHLAYGATLVALAITRRYIIYSQLGDGDIITVHADGVVTRPLPRQHEFMANQTTSLCSYRAYDEFQIRVDPIRAAAPALVMLSTDGYANCFGNDREFFRVGADFLKYLRAEGIEFVHEKLAGWLSQSSQDGSGDDITVGLAARVKTLGRGDRQ
jgi:serine/threonine protein phosphatase PrpC